MDDARTFSTTSSAPAGTYTLGAFTDDAAWSQVMQCLRDVYSPYAVTVTDQLAELPASASYTAAAIIAGTSSELGLDDPILGIAPTGGSCTTTRTDGADRVRAFANAAAASFGPDELCTLAAQQLGHVFGLDDSESVCGDPMTDRTDCGGEQFYRDASVACE